MATVRYLQPGLAAQQRLESMFQEQHEAHSMPPRLATARVTSLQQTTAAWLKKVIEDRSPPPTLYAWTAANLVSEPPHSPEDDSTSARRSPKRIYILGIGNLGRLIAASLCQSPTEPPITLVVHRKSLLEHWRASPGIEITRNGKVDKFTNFDVEWWTDEKPSSGPLQELTPIRNLIISTKAASVMPEIDRLRRYIHGESTVAFVQNGMCKLWGTAGEAYQRLRFPDCNGPNWLACVTTHAVSSLAHFRSIHTSLGALSVGPVSADTSRANVHHYLMNQIAHAPNLSAQSASAGELFTTQLEKLVFNSVVNPLTAIMDTDIGELFVERGDMLPQVVDAMIREASIVLTRLVLGPAGQQILGGGGADAEDVSSRGDFSRETLLHRFSFQNLQQMVYSIGKHLKNHIVSMLQDMRSGRPTEIQEYNGWLVQTAHSLGLGREVPTHKKVISIVEKGGGLSRESLVHHCLSEAIRLQSGPPPLLLIERL